MAEARTCGSSRNWSWASAAGGCCARSGYQPEVCHLNEGHAAFAVLERARTWMMITSSRFELRWRSLGPEIFSPRTRRWKPASIASPRT